MKGKKPARNFGGRPAEREPVLGKRTQLNIALPLPLKRRIEREALKQGRSISSEAAYRLEQSFEIEKVRKAASAQDEQIAEVARLLEETSHRIDRLEGKGKKK